MNVPFDHADAQLLLAAGYEHEFIPACWQDVGDAENGPKLDGNPDLDCYTLDLGTKLHVIVVVEGMLVEADYQPCPPPGYGDGDYEPVEQV